MNRFWRAAPARWAFSIALLVWLLAYAAALVGPIAGVSIVPNTFRGPIKSISEGVFFIGIFVSVVMDWVRGRPPWAAFCQISCRRSGRNERRT